MTGWNADVLGAGYESYEIDLGNDDEGALVATLVRALPQPQSFWQRLRGVKRPLEDVDVLYVHGWNDYFFQKGVAEFFTKQGARFFALDLRKYGRSLRPGQTFGYIEDLKSYDTEINAALQLMGHSIGEGGSAAQPKRRLLLHGHSTGGLILSLWSARHHGMADGLLLNSPWLTLQIGGAAQRALASVVSLRARLDPHDLALPQIDLGFYHQAQRHISDQSEQQLINREWRSEHSPPVRSGWLRAILAGHALIDEGIDVGAPVCVQLSDESIFGLSWRDEMARADTVINVAKVAKAALKLGNDVTVQRIPGALHNIFLSEAPAARRAFAGVDRWLTGWASASTQSPAASD